MESESDSDLTSSPPESMDVDSKSSETTNDIPEAQNDKPRKHKAPQYQILDVPPHLKLDNRQQFDMVAVLTNDNKIVMGTSIIGFRKRIRRPKKNQFYSGILKYDPAFLEVFSGEPQVQSFKERYPRRKNVLVLDKKADLNAEVFLRSNPKRMGHVVKVEVFVDLYLRRHNKIVTDILFTPQNHVISVNSNCWRSGVTVVWGKRKGRTIDCAYNCLLRDEEGRRVRLMVSMTSSHHKIDTCSQLQSHNLSQPFSPGDEVRVIFVKEGVPVEWLGEEGKLDNTNFVIEEIELSKVAVHWESHPRPSKGKRPFPGAYFSSNVMYDANISDDLYAIHSSFEELSSPFAFWMSNKDQNKTENEAFKEMTSYIEAKVMPFVKEKTLALKNEPIAHTAAANSEKGTNILAKTSKLLTSFITPFSSKAGSSKEKPFIDLKEKVKEKLQASKGDKDKLAALKASLNSSLASMTSSDYQPFTLKRRMDDYGSSNAEWIEVKNLQERSLLFLPQHAVNHNTRVKVTGQQHMISLESYYNRLIPDFEKNTKKKVPRLEETEMAEDVDFTSPVIGDVINRRTRTTIHWFDGEIQENVPANELGKTKRLHHPTDVQVYRNMLLRKTKPVKTAKLADKGMEEKQPKEFGVVTKVSEEKMLTVRWFEKGTKDDAKYEFKGEDVISQYEHIKHHWHRLSLEAIVYYPSGDRDPENVYDCVGFVESMNDDGTQTVRYLDGKEARFWPEEALAIDSGGSLGHPPVAAVLTEILPSSFDYHPPEPLDVIPVIATIPVHLPLHSNKPKQSSSAPATPSASDISTEMDLVAPIEPPKPKKVTRRFRFNHGASLENRFEMSLKRDKINFDSKQGIALFTAIYAMIETEIVEKMCMWEDTSYGEHLGDYKKVLEHPELKDIYDAVLLLHKRSKTAEESDKLVEIFNRRPDIQRKIGDLFNLRFNCTPKIVDLIRDFFVQLIQPPDFTMLRMRTRGFKEDTEEHCIVIYPIINSKEVKEFFDAQIENLNENKFEISRPRTLLSYICPASLSIFPVEDGKAMYFCQRSTSIKTTNFDSILTAYFNKFGRGETPVLAGTIKSIRYSNRALTAFDRLINDIPDPEVVSENEHDFVISQIAKADEALYKDGYHVYSSFPKYEYGPGSEKLDEGKKDMIDRMDFGLDQMVTQMNLDLNKQLEFRREKESVNPADSFCFSGELYPNITSPCALVLQISSSLPKEKLTDSFLYFQIMTQIAESSSWPDVVIKIHKDCGNANSLSNNFVVAWILLREMGMLSSLPYFNIAEALYLANVLKDQINRKNGIYFEKYGLESTQNLRNILLKMGSLSCIILWRRLNLVEQHFGFDRIIKSVKEILNGSSPTAFPIKDLPKIAEECKDEHIRKELEAIQISMAPTASPRYVAKGAFKTLDNVSSHSYIAAQQREMRRDFVATIKKEHKLLRENIAEGVHVITYADRLDLLRAIIIGPLDTPYQGVPFLFDILLGPSYPQEPPKVKYVSMTSQAINPNLYREGTVCLSLLGTWKGENPTMRWIPGTSNILQVVCSIQVEILMEANPYFNEPGFENRRNSEEGKAASRHYNGQVLVGSIEYFAEIMDNPPLDFSEFLRDYVKNVPDFLQRMRGALSGNYKLPFPVDINESVRHVVSRSLMRLEKAAAELEKIGPSTATTPEAQLNNLAEIFAIDPTTSLTMFSNGNPGSECSDLESFVILRN